MTPTPKTQVQPHFYFPDYQAMGDCAVCGQVEESPIHIEPGAKVMPDIDSMTGRELDAAVAERVMGCHWEGHRLVDAKGDCQFYRDQNGGIQANMEGNAFSSDWSAAALVVERMREMGFWFRCSARPEKRYWVAFDYENRLCEALGDTFPTAVCRAALKARESK